MLDKGQGFSVGDMFECLYSTLYFLLNINMHSLQMYMLTVCCMLL